MKILHIIPDLSKGGAERLTTDIVRALSKRPDITIMLVVLKDFIQYDISDIREYVRIIPSSISLSILGKDSFQIDDLQKFADEFRPDVIHSHLFYGDLVSKHLRYPGAKYFSHVHDNMAPLRNLSLSTLNSKKLLGNFYAKRRMIARYKETGTTFIAVSEPTADYLRQTLPSSFASCITVLKNAIDFRSFHQADGDRTLEEIKLINIGSFHHANKNQRLLVKIVSLVAARGRKVRVIFLGDGVQRKEVEKYAAELNVSGHVHFAGNVSDVPGYLREANLYVHTSFSESFGLVLLEAMAAGLPVVTLNGTGNADLVVNGENGYMINEPDADIFADRILEVCSDQSRYQMMRRNALALARTYDIKQYMNNLLDIYSKRDKPCVE